MKGFVAGIFLAAVLMLTNDAFFYESIFIPSSSMRPTLLPDERAFLRHFSYKPLKRFDVIVIKSKALGHRIVKRVIGLPGDCVQLTDAWQVSINGHPLEYEIVSDAPKTMREERGHLVQLERNPKFWFETKYGLAPLCLSKGQYYVLGDNRLASDDSRFIGPVTDDEIDGRVTDVWYSYDLREHHLRSDRVFRRVR